MKRTFQRGETVPVWLLSKNWEGVLKTPTHGVKLTITDPDGRRVGNISVTSSTSFTVGLVVTGTTSGATGLVIRKPDGTTLQLSQVTGTWESGEEITDTGSGTSTTSSVLEDIVMSLEDAEVEGRFVFYFNSHATDVKGWWKTRGISQDGTGDTARYTVVDGGFELTI